MVQLPRLTAVTTPLAVTDATKLLLLVHVRCLLVALAGRT